MGRRGKYKRKWKRRDRPKHERRDRYRKKKQSKKPQHRHYGVTHPFPKEVERERRERPEFERPRRREPGVVGIVERGRDDFRDRKLAVGYLVQEEKNPNHVHVFFAKDQPFYAFDLYNGAMIEEPEEVAEEGNQFSFRKYPTPMYHNTFTSHDPENPRRAFEPHCRNLAGGRINEMTGNRVPSEDIDEYKKNFEEFLELAGELFRAHGAY